MIIELKMEVLSSKESLINYLINIGIVPKLIKLINIGIENISYEASWILTNLTAAKLEAITIILDMKMHYKLVELAIKSNGELKIQVMIAIILVYVDTRKYCS